MVYCVKCGAKNPDDAKVCAKCGAPLYSVESEQPRRVEGECFEVEEECFGIPRGGAVVGLAIGIIIVLAGLSLLLQTIYPEMPPIPWWAFIIIMFGVLIIIGAIYGLTRKY